MNISKSDIVNLIIKKSKYDISKIKQRYIENQIDLLYEKKEFQDYNSLYLTLKDDQTIMDKLIEASLNHATRFYRNPEMFQVLTESFLPQLFEDKQRTLQPFNIWIPACSTGDEAYSLAIELNENFLSTYQNVDVNVFASDLSGTKIEEAQNGWYILDNLIALDEECKAKYFSVYQDRYKLLDPIKSLVSFFEFDLFNEPLKNGILKDKKFDLIICRNVLLYYEDQFRIQIIENLLQVLEEQGILIISEFEDVPQELWPVLNRTDVEPYIFRYQPDV